MPLNVFINYGIPNQISKGYLPTAYIIAFVAIEFTALSYSIMSRIYSSSGSAYTYTQKTFHPVLVFLVGWALLLDYIFNPIVASMLFGMYLNAQFPTINFYIFTTVFIVIISIVACLGVTVSAFISKLSVVLQVIFITVFVFFASIMYFIIVQ